MNNIQKVYENLFRCLVSRLQIFFFFFCFFMNVMEPRQRFLELRMAKVTLNMMPVRQAKAYSQILENIVLL